MKMYKTLIELLGAIKKSPRPRQLSSTGLISIVKQLKIEHLSCGHKIICFFSYSPLIFSCVLLFFCSHFSVVEIQIENHFLLLSVFKAWMVICLVGICLPVFG